MTWVKICGITNLEDALLAVEAGADAVGFVFYEKSPRCVNVETVRGIVAKLPKAVEKIGVFVDPATDAIGVHLAAGLTGTQSYVFSRALGGSGGPTKGIAASRLPPNARFILAVPVGLMGDNMSQFEQTTAAFAESRKQHAELPAGIWDTFLLDSGNSQQPGGTGNTFDWGKAVFLAANIQRSGLKLVVAGGLKPENVSEAIGVLHPWGVDVVSGVEARPGKKDPEKVRAFVRAVREYDAKAS